MSFYSGVNSNMKIDKILILNGNEYPKHQVDGFFT